MFLRMIELSTVVKENHHHIRLNRGFRSDLQWWACFLTKWNGANMMSRVSNDIRFVGLMGSWRIHIQGGLVSADMAPILGRGPHHG